MADRKFANNYVLIDYENVQPKNLELLVGDHFHVFLFVGAKQTKISVELAAAMHQFENRGRYIRISQTRNDALDFHIAFYVGELSSLNEQSYFHIISKDKGFDPLIEHLQNRKIQAHRRDSVADIPVLNVKQDAEIKVKLAAVVTNLKGRGLSKPRKEKTLRNTIRTIFRDPLTENEVDKIVHRMMTSKYITSKNGNISYALPDQL